MQPISQNNPSLQKGPSSSAEFNKLRNDIHLDLVKLFDIANIHESEIARNMDVLIRENFFMQNKLAVMQDYIDKIEIDLLNKQSGLNKQTLIKSFYSLDGLSDGDLSKEALVNTTYGYVSIPNSDSVSKIMHKGDDGTIVVPASLGIEVRESNNVKPIDSTTGKREEYLIEDDNIMLAFDGSKNSFWVHTSTFPEDSGVSEVYGNVVISLPVDVMTNSYANTLTLNPVPEYGLTIRDITYKGLGEQWFRLENYPTEKNGSGLEVPIEIKDAGKLTFSFSNTEITQLQIEFSQPYWFANEKKRDFVYGFQEIELENRVYSSTEAEIVSEFNIEGTTKRFQVISVPEVTPMIGSEQEIEDLIEHKLYYSKELSSEFKFGNEIMADIQKVYVKTIIKSSGDVVPMIRKISLDYSFKDVNEA